MKTQFIWKLCYPFFTSIDNKLKFGCSNISEAPFWNIFIPIAISLCFQLTKNVMQWQSNLISQKMKSGKIDTQFNSSARWNRIKQARIERCCGARAVSSPFSIHSLTHKCAYIYLSFTRSFQNVNMLIWSIHIQIYQICINKYIHANTHTWILYHSLYQNPVCCIWWQK